MRMYVGARIPVEKTKTRCVDVEGCRDFLCVRENGVYVVI